MVLFPCLMFYFLQFIVCTALKENFLKDNLIMSLFSSLGTHVLELSSQPTVIGGFLVCLPHSVVQY